jgi:hypothetical protein
VNKFSICIAAPHVFLMLNFTVFLSSCSFSECAAESCNPSVQVQQTPSSDAKIDEMMKAKPENTEILTIEVVEPATHKTGEIRVILESVDDIHYDGAQVSARVMSNGCTSSEDFHVEHAVLDGVCQVTIVRDKQDFCRMMPDVMQVKIEWEQTAECSNNKLNFLNPLLIEPKFQPGKIAPEN